MTKSELINIMANKMRHISHRDVEITVNEIFDCMVGALCGGDRIEIRGFGSFEIRKRRAREGRNPKLGTQVFVSARRVPFFKVGKELRERVSSTTGSVIRRKSESSNEG